MSKIICISGKAQNGKDTFAEMLKEELKNKGKKVLVAHYGDLVKYVCKTFFDWDGIKDEKGRSLLQYVGTDIVRNEIPNFWVNFICDVLTLFKDNWDYVLIPDTRFPNELNCMRKNFDALHVMILRDNFKSPLSLEQQSHESETALDKSTPDFLIHNLTLDLLKVSAIDLANELICKDFNDLKFENKVPTMQLFVKDWGGV